MLPSRDQLDRAIARLMASERQVDMVLDDWGKGPNGEGPGQLSPTLLWPNFSFPCYDIKIHSSAGQSPDGFWMCDDELRRPEVTAGL